MDCIGTMSFVWGYLPGVDVCSDVATKAGLLQRFSLAFSSYSDFAPEMTLNRDLVVGTLNDLLQLFPHDGLVATDRDGAVHASLEEACLCDAETKDWDPIQSVRVSQGDQMTCYVEHEPYQDVGGPSPYHDAFVYAFYCRTIDRSTVQDALFLHAVHSKALILEVISGATRPMKSSWWRRLLKC